MMKQMITALTFSLCAASVFAAGSVKVITTGSTEAKMLTGAEHLLDLVGQPRLSNSWWPGAVISEERATTEAQRQQQALLARLAALSAEASGDDAGAINALRQQIQALKVTGRQTINLDPDVVRTSEPGNPPLQGNYTLWVGPQPTDITLLGLLSHPGKQPLYPDVMLPAISMGSIGSAARIVATPGLSIPTDAHKKYRSPTGTNVTLSRCPAASFLSGCRTLSGAAPRMKSMPTFFAP